MRRISLLLAALFGKAVVYEGDPCTDYATPLMCRAPMSLGTRFCELPFGHAGGHLCRATRHPCGAIVAR